MYFSFNRCRRIEGHGGPNRTFYKVVGSCGCAWGVYFENQI
jgi:hypothetical protein